MSYCEMVKKRESAESSEEIMTRAGSMTVGVANIFLSFAFVDNFMEVMRCLQYYLISKNAGRDREQLAFVWISMFSVDQNKAETFPMDWWSVTFKRSIGEIGRVVMVALPWKNPTTLHRSWCLWEIFCSIETGSEFDVALSEGQQKLLFDEILSRDSAGDAVNDMLGTIDCAKSQCYKAEDRVQIFAAVRATQGGFHRVNSLILERMRNWMIEVTGEEYLRESDRTRKQLLLMSQGELLMQQGKYKEAESI